MNKATGGPLSRAFNISDLRDMAQRRLPRGFFEYVDRGCEDEFLLRRNRDAFDRLRFCPRALIDVSARTTAATFMGQTHDMPVAIAPTAAAGLLWHDGEVAIAKAAAAANIPFSLSINSTTPLERVSKQAGGRLWFQLYVWADKELSYQAVARARDAGFEGLIVTVDTPVHANREYNLRNGFGLPFKLSPKALMDMTRRPRWLCGVLGRYVVTTGYPKFENYPARQRTSVTDAGRLGAPTLCESLSWPDIAKLRDLWPGTFIVKGIMSPQDAVLAFKHGADAVVLSNHGGRNLDSSLSTIEVLPEMVAAVGPGARIILDSGIRRGADIAKALALGAHGVLIGRAPLYGAAVAGQAGAAHAIALLKRELDTVMAMTGRPGIADLTPDLIM